MIELSCERCSRPFLVTPARRSTARFCSGACYHAEHLGKRRYDSRGKVPNQCLVCGTPFLMGGRGNKAYGSRFCSWECRNAARFRTANRALPLDPFDAAYLAGLIDGEGSIILSLPRNSVVSLFLSVSNTNFEILEWVKKTTGVGGINVTREEGPFNARSGFWRTSSEGAETVIQQVRPHLKIKSAQADLALETMPRLRTPALKADRAWQREYADRMKAMNKRGPKAATPTAA